MLEYLLNGWTRALSDVTDGRVGLSVAVTTLPDGEIVEISPKLFPTADQYPGLSVGRAARPLDTPDRPSRSPDKGQTGID
jgi:hypothetical protein